MNTTTTKKRVLAIDLARGMSVLLVIAVHTLWMYGDVYTQGETWLGTIIHFIGKGTPMFLIAMGFSFCLSRRQDTKGIFYRALGLLGIGYGMNLFKFVIPYFLGILPKNLLAAYGWTAPLEAWQLVYLVQTGDILQLAGISLMLLMAVQQLGNDKRIPLVLAIGVAFVTPFVRGFRVGISGVDYLFDLLWGAEWNVYFAVFPWFSFILLGMFFGAWYKEQEQEEFFIFQRMLGIGVVLLLLGGGLSYYNFEYHFNDYFHLGPGGAVYLAGFNLILFFIAYKFAEIFPQNRFFDFLCYCSQRVTTLYAFQWIIICFGMSVLGYQRQGQAAILPLTIVIAVLTFFIQYLYDRWNQARHPKNNKPLAPSSSI